MERIIEFFKKRHYGRTEVVPYGTFAHEIKTLTRRKTLSRDDVAALSALGFSFREIPVPDNHA